MFDGLKLADGKGAGMKVSDPWFQVHLALVKSFFLKKKIACRIQAEDIECAAL